MPFIKNTQQVATSEQRKVVLSLIETGLEAIQPAKVMEAEFRLQGPTLYFKDQSLDLKLFDRVFLIGFGKGAAEISKIIEQKLGDILTGGFVIDNVTQEFNNIEFTLGTHPLPSAQNIEFTKKVLSRLTGMTEKDLVLVVICGGGSAMFEYPYKLGVEEIAELYQSLIKSGATIEEINTVRKHLSQVKGGGLAKKLYPAKILSLIFSDVPGDDLTTIASGPTVRDTTDIEDIKNILYKHAIVMSLDNFIETPHDENFFKNVKNIIMLSNFTALNAMAELASHLGYTTKIFSSRMQGDAHKLGKDLISKTQQGEIMLIGGESTLEVKGKGRGGRNQVVVLSSLPYLDEKTIIASFDSDGIDNYYYAGAIADKSTVEKSQKLNLDINKFLKDDNSYEFFNKIGDGILTDKLESNVSDLIIIAKI